MTTINRQVEVLSFVNGDNLATIVTDGERHKSFEMECARNHTTLAKAIAYLEAKGFRVLTDKFDSLK